MKRSAKVRYCANAGCLEIRIRFTPFVLLNKSKNTTSFSFFQFTFTQSKIESKWYQNKRVVAKRMGS
ncbi:hypothetical protein LEP1GSC203_1789 [Leptospira terpstrae serovar Hualin str. LT 11-33 = ATCC 700639]|uniref:Uncharacterized protein n=1 Tax=Leptospira terpstrae serovar Hualin str. LT 11-33 = ATCC 700639 TaxID=1257025 RepID=N1VNZ4_9LEPT|nr:hypothetical protein LEP1GSC203_1789 [Leptospira terpstrae serovar Hualin str. LT 11-33 = ATCC 700639]